MGDAYSLTVVPVRPMTQPYSDWGGLPLSANKRGVDPGGFEPPAVSLQSYCSTVGAMDPDLASVAAITTKDGRYCTANAIGQG